MHIEADDLYGIAAAELYGTLLSDVQSRMKRHLGECRECYERYCAYITMLNLTESAFWMDEDENIGKGSVGMNDVQDVILKIQLAGAVLLSVQTCGGHIDSCWNFIHRQGMAAARSSGNEMESDTYISMESEYSQIRREGNRLIIRLDEEVFPAGLLGVRYKENGRTVTHRFEYNEDTECHEAVIDRNGHDDDMTVEIVWL